METLSKWFGIAWEPDTREFIMRSAELWNRWNRFSCYYNRVAISGLWINEIYAVVSGQYSYTIQQYHLFIESIVYITGMCSYSQVHQHIVISGYQQSTKTFL